MQIVVGSALLRITTDADRITADAIRISADPIRISADPIRISPDTIRISTDTNRTSRTASAASQSWAARHLADLRLLVSWIFPEDVVSRFRRLVAGAACILSRHVIDRCGKI